MTSRLRPPDRKSTRLNSSHLGISYAVFCLKNRSDRKSTRLNSSHLGISYAVFRLKRRNPAGTACRLPPTAAGSQSPRPPRPAPALNPAGTADRLHPTDAVSRSPRPPLFLNDAATTEIYTLSLHDALPISTRRMPSRRLNVRIVHHQDFRISALVRSEEHTSELQSLRHLVCRLLLEKK